jgi:hypothetical protein
VGSSPDEVDFFFPIYLILPANLWPMRSTQALTQMRTRNLSGGKGRPARKADNLSGICEPTVQKMWEPRASQQHGYGQN